MFDSLSGALSKAYRAIVGQKVLTEANVQEGIRSVRQALLEADVHFKVAKDFVQDVEARVVGAKVIESVNPGDQFIKSVHDGLTDLLGGQSPGLPVADKGPLILMMAGLQGSGKTTTCAKLALLLKRRKKKNPLLVAADLQRPAAVQQLQTLGKQLDVAVYAEGVDAAPPEVCKRGIAHAIKQQHDVVILDTAGRLHIDDELMTELETIQKKCKPHGVILVCDAMTGQDVVKSTQEFHERLPIHGVVLTKTDGDARGGAALSIKHLTGRHILYVGTGEKLDELEEFDPPRMAGRILGMGDVVGLVERAQEVIDEKEAEKDAKRMLKGQFDFEMFLKSMNMIRKLGPMKKVLGMLPGMGSALKDLDLDDKRFQGVEAMIQSMTPIERRAPAVIDVQRRRRIAKGSGNDLDAVHALIKQFKQMQKLMSKFGKGGMPGMDDMLGGGGPGMPGGGLPGMGPGMPDLGGMLGGGGGKGTRKGGGAGRPSGLDDFLRGRRR